MAIKAIRKRLKKTAYEPVTFYITKQRKDNEKIHQLYLHFNAYRVQTF